MSAARRWQRLRAHLDAYGATEVGDVAGRVGAVLALLHETERDLELILTKRRDDLPTHPGQVSFPGGRREPGESTTEAALREGHEEIGLRIDSVEVLGHLAAFFLPPSRYWLAPVVARWVAPHPLRAQESEVAALLHVPLAHLLDMGRWRKVRLSVTGWSLAWQLDGGHVLWGATAMVTGVLLDALEPGWRRDVEPSDLADDAEITPWLDPRLRRRVPPARLAGVDARDRDSVGAPDGVSPDPAAVEAAGAAIVETIEHLRDRPERIVVLAGTGGNGAAGSAAAAQLRRRGAHVAVVAADAERLARERASVSEPVGGDQRERASVSEPVGGDQHDGEVRTFNGALPPADLYVDALVGGGLRGRLHGTPLDMLLALRSHDAPILAVDLPTGLHPTDGLIGDTLSATVTLALSGVWPVLNHAGLSPFVGDLYLWDGRGRDIIRLVAGPERAALQGGWRE